jgi:hypothetical protein
MSHGFGSYAWNARFGTRAGRFNPRLGRFVVRYLELRFQLFGLEARETGLHLLVLALLVVSTIICFVGFVAMLIVFLLYLMMLTLHWEWGWSAPGTCSGASCCQYWSRSNLQIQDRETVFPWHLR